MANHTMPYYLDQDFALGESFSLASEIRTRFTHFIEIHSAGLLRPDKHDRHPMSDNRSDIIQAFIWPALIQKNRCVFKAVVATWEEQIYLVYFQKWNSFFFFLLFSSSICMSKCKLISWEERKKPKLCSFECQMSFHRERIKINIVMRNSSVCSNLLLRSSKAASIQLAPERIACSQFYSCTAADSADSNLWCLLVCWIVSRLVSLGRSHTVHSICVWTDGRNSLVHKCSQWISLYHPV